mmetsp:Transcript_28156/g.72891  ORF Transcript_28156/g.72891 Transcript_28156/m.72891 type:complete len:136 (+) Transcript_28156:81-488(+)
MGDLVGALTCGAAKSGCCCREEDCTQHAIAMKNLHASITQPCIVDSGELQFEFVRNNHPPVRSRRFNESPYARYEDDGEIYAGTSRSYASYDDNQNKGWSRRSDESHRAEPLCRQTPSSSRLAAQAKGSSGAQSS